MRFFITKIPEESFMEYEEKNNKIHWTKRLFFLLFASSLIYGKGKKDSNTLIWGGRKTKEENKRRGPCHFMVRTKKATFTIRPKLCTLLLGRRNHSKPM